MLAISQYDLLQNFYRSFPFPYSGSTIILIRNISKPSERLMMMCFHLFPISQRYEDFEFWNKSQNLTWSTNLISILVSSTNFLSTIQSSISFSFKIKIFTECNLHLAKRSEINGNRHWHRKNHSEKKIRHQPLLCVLVDV